MTQAPSAKKETQRLQRAIVDGLEDVKAQDIQVYDTEHLSPLFERVIVASGTSNRQTKALASSVRDAVREAGFGKPRIEGEENGEWIIVDCGAAVAHIMQPAIRNYYHLEEIWGDKPVRLKLGAPKPMAAASAPAAAPRKAAASPSLRRSSAVKAAAQAERAEKADGKAAPAKKRAVKTATGRPASSKAPAKAPARAPARASAKRPATAAGKTAPARTASGGAGKTTARKTSAKKPSPRA